MIPLRYLFLILLMACQPNHQDQAIEKEQSFPEKAVRDTLVVPEDTFAPDSLPTFTLIAPNMQLIQEEMKKSPGTLLYIYLKTHYTALGSWKKIQEFDGDLCEFKQTFVPDLYFYQQACTPGTEISQLILPSVREAELKKFMAILYQSEEYNWSADGLSYKSSQDGLTGSGCEFSYTYQNGKVGISVFCSD